MAERVERLHPILIDHGIRTPGFEPWLSQANDLNTDASLALCITRVGQGVVE